MPSTKRKQLTSHSRSDSFIASNSDSASPPPIKQSKKSKPSHTNTTTTTTTTTFTPASNLNLPTQQQTDTEGNPYWSISNSRRVTVSDFKGKKMVSVREYYEKGGEWLPGKKGITMTLDQYNEFIKVLPSIERVLGGGSVGRPDYDGLGKSNDGHVDDEGDGDGDEEVVLEDGGGRSNGHGDGSGKKSTRKSNIEATSDEDDGDD